MSRQQVVNELHRSARKNFKRRRVISKGIRDLLQADIVEMIPYSKENKNFKYLLTVIDVFSKFAWAIPLKSKTGKEVTDAIATILTKHRYRNIQTDHGTEFYNTYWKRLMEKYNVNHYSTYSHLKASIVERFNKTLKNNMWKQFSMQGTYKWLGILESLINKYNNTKHSTIKMKPVQVNKNNEAMLLNTVYSNVKIAEKPKFKMGDHVRISKYNHVFAKGYQPSWTAEIFKIYKIQITNPVTYLLEDYQQNMVKGSFYEQELQKVKFPAAYLVDKILRRKDDKIYVKWYGFNEKHNSWINKKDLL